MEHASDELLMRTNAVPVNAVAAAEDPLLDGTMATIYTHAFAGVGLASLLTPRSKPLLFWALAGLLPVLPDFDTFWTAPYGSSFGHRGFTHSLAFALAVGLVSAGATFRYFHMRFWPLFGLYFLVTASHGVLDALTNGGYGIAFFWPITDQRWGPYGPINVSDIALEFPDPRTSRAVRTELLYVWLPLGIAVALTEGCRWLRRHSRLANASALKR
jgi:inner membrane protein